MRLCDGTGSTERSLIAYGIFGKNSVRFVRFFCSRSSKGSNQAAFLKKNCSWGLLVAKCVFFVDIFKLIAYAQILLLNNIAVALSGSTSNCHRNFFAKPVFGKMT